MLNQNLSPSSYQIKKETQLIEAMKRAADDTWILLKMTGKYEVTKLSDTSKFNFHLIAFKTTLIKSWRGQATSMFWFESADVIKNFQTKFDALNVIVEGSTSDTAVTIFDSLWFLSNFIHRSEFRYITFISHRHSSTNDQCMKHVSITSPQSDM